MPRILLLEPDSQSARLVRQYIENGTYTVDFAHSSQEALHCADGNKPDLVILELAIRDHNGFAFLHEFRSYNDWAKIPVIIFSHIDVSEASMSESWKSLGAKYYFYKPTTTLAELKKAIDDVLL